MPNRMISRSWLSRASYDVAPDLLGCRLSRQTDEGLVVVEITEVEAYSGEKDPASHAYRGQSARNAVMFGRAGYLYAYLSYGIHTACNIVTGPDGEASAVLVRAGRVVAGEELARERRGPSVRPTRLATGPGCLARALGLSLADYGRDLLDGGPVTLSAGTPVDSASVSSGPRVGVSQAVEVPWRFWVKGDRTVSAYRRSPRAEPVPGPAAKS